MTADEIVQEMRARVWDADDRAKFAAEIESLAGEAAEATEEDEAGLSAAVIIEAIATGSWTADDFNGFSRAVNEARAAFTARARYTYQNGQRVKFTSRSRQVVAGVIKKINQKTATLEHCLSNGVPCYLGGVRVPLSMLSPV